jgi:hypothetical protein
MDVATQQWLCKQCRQLQPVRSPQQALRHSNRRVCNYCNANWGADLVETMIVCSQTLQPLHNDWNPPLNPMDCISFPRVFNCGYLNRYYTLWASKLCSGEVVGLIASYLEDGYSASNRFRWFMSSAVPRLANFIVVFNCMDQDNSSFEDIHQWKAIWTRINQ